jgi:predicted Zn-dependent protease
MRKIVSLLLFKLGDEKAGDEAMLNFLEILKENKLEDAYDSFSTAFVIYALECNNPKKAQTIAEEILKKNPDDSFALTVKMKLLAESNNIEEARKIARKILTLDDDPDLPDYKAATELLARDPNQKKQNKPR